MVRLRWALVVISVTVGMARAQTPAAPAPPPTLRNSTQVPPATVSAGADRGTAGELPLNTPKEEPGADVTPATSPVTPGPHGNYLEPGTTLTLQLTSPANSRQQHNGDLLRGTLLVPARTLAGVVLRAGTPVEVTVLSSAAAGTMQSYGVLTLELVRVGGVGVFSNVLDFNGQEGHKILPDSAPDKGTEATVAAGATLRFEVQGAGNNPDPTERPRGGGAGQGGSGSAGPGAGNSGTETPGSPGSATPTPGGTGTAPGTTPAQGTSRPSPQPTQPR